VKEIEIELESIQKSRDFRRIDEFSSTSEKKKNQ